VGVSEAAGPTMLAFWDLRNNCRVVPQVSMIITDEISP
jgi:hypothetical protein